MLHDQYRLNCERACANELGGATDRIDSYSDAASFGAMATVRKLWDARCYESVAVVRTPPKAGKRVAAALDFAYKHTNHLDALWDADNAHPAVKRLHHEQNRSTSIGDVLVIAAGGTRRAYVAKTLGFDSLG